VLNSLKVDTKSNVLVPFRPQSGNLIKWYICGPTVYDSAHFGHARYGTVLPVLGVLVACGCVAGCVSS
jgi:cysteinyl-tRNA synthetase